MTKFLILFMFGFVICVKRSVFVFIINLQRLTKRVMFVIKFIEIKIYNSYWSRHETMGIYSIKFREEKTRINIRKPVLSVLNNFSYDLYWLIVCFFLIFFLQWEIFLFYMMAIKSCKKFVLILSFTL